MEPQHAHFFLLPLYVNDRYETPNLSVMAQIDDEYQVSQPLFAANYKVLLL